LGLDTPHFITSLAMIVKNKMLLFPNMEIKINKSRCGMKGKSIQPQTDSGLENFSMALQAQLC